MEIKKTVIGWGTHEPVPSLHKTHHQKTIAMKTALKLSKKQLLELYGKSNEKIKESLRAEFGNGFFEAQPNISEQVMVSKPVQAKPIRPTGGRGFINWEAIFEFTPVLRMVGYAALIGLIFSIF